MNKKCVGDEAISKKMPSMFNEELKLGNMRQTISLAKMPAGKFSLGSGGGFGMLRSLLEQKATESKNEVEV